MAFEMCGWIEWKLENTNEISQRTDGDPLVASSVVSVSSKSRTVHVKMLTDILPRNKCVLLSDPCLPKALHSGHTHCEISAVCDDKYMWKGQVYNLKFRTGIISFHNTECPGHAHKGCSQDCLLGFRSWLTCGTNTLQSKLTILRNTDVIFFPVLNKFCVIHVF